MYKGGNFDENYDKIDIDFYRQEFVNKYGIIDSYPKFKWLKSFYDHIIRFHDNHLRKEKDWDFHYDYTVYNHIRHGLPENWQYTSLNYSGLIDNNNI
ncbi:MAG: hypothetical protein A2Y82_05065 [Candidatus Buchananbacteria bacterium RBG_13_36_9]|uniref:Uncharacterized protein n=1 Tax=Candidatus Buchananbacteria bacterium RBG_13_36_9 TaxID=1797530 RepID=A0A1G1XPN0_9BACT|nr:MAG: hypothetical protein A2Y82_05065 [Candidatus Buchananbacteria bacterium RBG_13_36_9]